MVSDERHMEAMDRIAKLVAVRERTRSELAERLRKDGFEDDEVTDAVGSAMRCGLVDEERFARAYIRGKLGLGWGRLRIEKGLKEKGLGDEILESCIDEYPDSEDELATAMRILSKKKSTAKDPYSSYMRRLVSKGYTYDTARRAVRAFMANETI